MADRSDKDFQRLRWQCRRGLLELDCIFEDYLDQRYPGASEEEQHQFRELLNEQDPDLQAWLLHGETCPREFHAIVRVLRGV